MKTYISAKIHGLTVTDVSVDYNGSVSMSRILLDAVGIDPYEQVHIVNLTNGNRWVTYVLPIDADNHAFTLNGGGAYMGKMGDRCVVMTYDIKPQFTQAKVIFVDEQNAIVETMIYENLAMTMRENLMTHHGLQLKPWQLGTSVILVKLEPQPKTHWSSPDTWVWNEEGEVFGALIWKKNKPVPHNIYKRIAYKVGNCIYHQEEWVENAVINSNEPIILRGKHPDVCGDEPDLWNTANTMPSKAATEWRKIVGVEVLQGIDIDNFDDYQDMGLTDYFGPLDEFDPEDQVGPRLDELGITTADTWAIALTVEPCHSPKIDAENY